METGKDTRPGMPDITSEKMLILLVEDSETDAYTAKRVLEKHMTHAFALHHAASMTEAKKALQQNADFDVILLDLGLPDTDGNHDTFRQINELHPDIPVLVLTSVNDHDMAVEMIGDGAEDYIRKAVIAKEPDILCEAIDFAVCRYRCMKAALKEKDEVIREKEKVVSWMSGDYTKTP